MESGSARNKIAKTSGKSDRTAVIQKTVRTEDSFNDAAHKAPRGEARDRAMTGHMSACP